MYKNFFKRKKLLSKRVAIPYRAISVTFILTHNISFVGKSWGRLWKLYY